MNENSVKTIQTTIANGASLSTGVRTGGITSVDGAQVPLGFRLSGVIMPSEWTAADLTFQASYDGGATYVDIYDYEGTEVSAIAAASRLIVLNPVVFAAIPMLKVRSGTTASAVNQGAARTLSLVLRSI